MPQRTIKNLFQVLLYSVLTHVLIALTSFTPQIGISILIGLLFAFLNEIVSQLLISNELSQNNVEKVIELEEMFDPKYQTKELPTEVITYLEQINQKK